MFGATKERAGAGAGGEAVGIGAPRAAACCFGLFCMLWTRAATRITAGPRA